MNKQKITILTFSLLLVGSMLSAQGDVVRKRHNYEFSAQDYLIFEIEIDAAEVKISPNTHETELSVFLKFNDESFDYDIDFDEHDNNISLSFEKKQWIDDHDGQLRAEIEILLPPSVVVDLDCRIKAGEVDMQLGDLSLKRLALKTWAGDVRVDFQQPNRIAMRSLLLNTKIGETRLKNLGNARFRHAEINNGIGQLEIDFTGLAEGASADVDLDIGATEIFIPDEVGVKLSVHKFLFLSQVDIPHKLRKKGKYYISDNYHRDDKSVILKVKPGIGDLRISYH